MTVTRRDRSSSMATVYSATERALVPGVFLTGIPHAAAALVSILSRPTPCCWISLQRTALRMTSAVQYCWRRMMASSSSGWSKLSTSSTCARSRSTADGAMGSLRYTFMVMLPLVCVFDVRGPQPRHGDSILPQSAPGEKTRGKDD